MSKIAIITARGGSKRIPRKNIKDFLGKPIIAYSIESALKSELFDEVMVSTDDKEIAEIALQYGAKIPFIRSEKNADDFASTVDVLLEVLEEYKKRGQEFDFGCCIYPTAPFVNEELLNRSYSLLINNQFDTVFPVVKFGFPIQRAIKLSESGRMDMFQPEHKKTRSQDLEPAFHDSGQFYWFSVERILHQKQLWTDNTGVVVMSEMQTQDIDNADDWRLAELKYKLLLDK